MKTIEERAIECCMTKFPVHETADAESMRQGYIKGATDQMEIDIEKACEWLKANSYAFRSDEFLEPLIEAMKGE